LGGRESSSTDKNGVTINTPKSEGDEGWHREMEIDVALTIPAAMQVKATLDNFIKLAVEQMNQLKQQLDKLPHKPENK
jgi:hypothetical protein